jgi:quercetin dioxygenase-like cupin family protein
MDGPSPPVKAIGRVATTSRSARSMANLVDISEVEALDVWGDTIQARVITGANASLAVVELAPNAVVPGHQHVNEQLGLCLVGSLTFTIGDETRELHPGGTWRIPSNVLHDAVAGPDGAVIVDIFAPVRADWAALPRSRPREDRWPID